MGSTAIGGRGPLRRRALVIDAFIAGEPLTDDFLRCEASKMIGELVLDELDLAIEVLLTVRSREGAIGAIALMSSSGNKENQLSDAITASPAYKPGDWS